MWHEISVDTDLDIRDDQLFEKQFKFSFFFENLVSIEYSLKWPYFKVIPFMYTGKNKVYNWDKCRRYTWKICGRHIWPNLAG